MKKLNNLGIAHWIVPVAIVVLVGIGGVYFIVAGHAQTQTVATPSVSGYGCSGTPKTLPLLVKGWPNPTGCVELAKKYLNQNTLPIRNLSGGSFGANMLTDVKAFQRDYQFKSVDGQVGVCTWYALTEPNHAIPVSVNNQYECVK